MGNPVDALTSALSAGWTLTLTKSYANFETGIWKMGEDGAWSPEIPKVSANVTAGNSEVKDGPSSEMNASGGEQDSQSTASFGSCDPSDTSPPSIDAL